MHTAVRGCAIASGTGVLMGDNITAREIRWIQRRPSIRHFSVGQALAYKTDEGDSSDVGFIDPLHSRHLHALTCLIPRSEYCYFE